MCVFEEDKTRKSGCVSKEREEQAMFSHKGCQMKKENFSITSLQASSCYTHKKVKHCMRKETFFFRPPTL